MESELRRMAAGSLRLPCVFGKGLSSVSRGVHTKLGAVHVLTNRSASAGETCSCVALE